MNSKSHFGPKEEEHHCTDHLVREKASDGNVLCQTWRWCPPSTSHFHTWMAFINQSTRCLCPYSTQAWMDQEMMLKWIDLVWEPATERKHALLVLLQCSCHQWCKKAFDENQHTASYHPRRMYQQNSTTWCSLNKRFKVIAREHWSDYVMTQPEQVTTKKKLRPPQKVGCCKLGV